MKSPPRAVSYDLNVEYLLTFLEDELRDLQDVRIHPVAPSGTRRSPDLPQDYDPNEGQVHRHRGVRVRVKSRDYFFPADWATQDLDAVRAQAREIRDFHEANR